MYDGSECAAHEDSEQTRWLKVTTGVNQSCVMSGFLFLPIVDWVMQRTTNRHRNGVRWDFTNTLKDLDSGLSCTQVRKHPGQDWQTHHKWQQDQIKLNPIKCRVMRIHAKRQDSVRVQHKRNWRLRGVCLPWGNNAEAQKTWGTRWTRQEGHSRICSRYGQQTALAPMNVKPDRHKRQKRTERM